MTTTSPPSTAADSVAAAATTASAKAGKRRPPVQLAYRALKELATVYGPPDNQHVEAFEKQTGGVRGFVYSKDGRYLAWSTIDGVKVVDAETMKPVGEMTCANVLDLEFSPRGSYISTLERYVKKEGEEAAHRNMTIWETKSGTAVAGFTQRNQQNWNVQWSSDEEFCAHRVTNEVHLYHAKQLTNGKYTVLRLEGVSAVSVSPGRSPSIAVFMPERGGSPASVRIYSLTNFQRPTASKSFFKADGVQMYWNDLGTHLLVLTQTDVDKTGKSYYGESGLYYLTVAGSFDCRVDLDKEGPIHDVAWSPDSKEFVVIYGFMPAKATLFDHRAEPIHQFGAQPRNHVRFSPHGRLICLAGFGNLAGTVDMWDRRNLGKRPISTLQASGASVCEWCPDGRHLITATLSPRLRVDNGYKIWHYRGVLVHKEDIDELYQVAWRPAIASLYPVRNSLSPAPKGITVAQPKAAESKPMGVYRPPGARGTATPSIFRRADEKPGQQRAQRPSPVPGAPASDSDAASSKATLKNKKRRDKKKTEPVPRDAAPTNGVASKEKPSQDAKPSSPAASRSPPTETEKKIKVLQRKLKQITELKERQARGESLELTQTKKIETEDSVRAALTALQ